MMRTLHVTIAASVLLMTLQVGSVSGGAAQTHSAAQKLGAKPTTTQPLFVDVTRAAGIDFRLTCGSLEKLYIVETMCGGAAAFDYDNDGWLDILLVDGSTLADYRAG